MLMLHTKHANVHALSVVEWKQSLKVSFKGDFKFFPNPYYSKGSSQVHALADILQTDWENWLALMSGNTGNDLLTTDAIQLAVLWLQLFTMQRGCQPTGLCLLPFPTPSLEIFLWMGIQNTYSLGFWSTTVKHNPSPMGVFSCRVGQ